MSNQPPTRPDLPAIAVRVQGSGVHVNLPATPYGPPEPLFSTLLQLASLDRRCRQAMQERDRADRAARDAHLLDEKVMADAIVAGEEPPAATAQADAAREAAKVAQAELNGLSAARGQVYRRAQDELQQVAPEWSSELLNGYAETVANLRHTAARLAEVSAQVRHRLGLLEMIERSSLVVPGSKVAVELSELTRQVEQTLSAIDQLLVAPLRARTSEAVR